MGRYVPDVCGLVGMFLICSGVVDILLICMGIYSPDLYGLAQVAWVAAL